jgi:integrase/recombinase XerD
MTWNDYLPEYKRHLEENFSEHTANAYYRDINELISFTDKEDPLTITVEDINELMAVLEDEDRLSSSTRIRCLSGIKYFYKYLISLHIIESTPIFDIKAPELEIKLPQLLSVEDIDKLISACDLTYKIGYRNRAIIEMIYCAGLTVTEISNLRICDIDLKKEEVNIVKTKANPRTIPMIQKLRDALILYLNVIRNKTKQSDNDLLFPNQQTTRMSLFAVQKVIKDLAVKADVKDANPRSLRYSCQFHLAERGADLRIIKYMTGSRLPSLNPRYLHPSVKYIREALNQYHPHAS